MYLSFVISASNASYEGNFIERLKRSIESILRATETAELDAELIIVEWNPPADRPPLRKVLRGYNHASRPRFRLIEVPRAIHEALPNPNEMKFFEYWAKNVGIRRATGQFILSTNADDIYSRALVNEILTTPLDEDHFYRVNRADIEDSRILRTWYASGHVLPGQPRPPVKRIEYPFGVRDQLHYQASGDFLLMAASRWRSLGGYPEKTFNRNIDSYLVYLAASKGLRQVVFDEVLFHQDHPRETGHSRIVDSEDYHEWIFVDEEVVGPPVAFQNDDTWGFPHEEFQEVALR